MKIAVTIVCAVVGFACVIAGIAYALLAQERRLPQGTTRATFIQIVTKPDSRAETVSLSLGVSSGCQFGGNLQECKLDNIIELSVGGKNVASIPASTLTASQQELLKIALQSLIDRTNMCSSARPAPVLPAIPIFDWQNQRSAMLQRY